MVSELHSSSVAASPVHPLATLYGQWTFNFMVDIAAAIADDFVERPRQYRKASDGLTNVLSGFRSSLGLQPDWPNAEQRTSVFRVLSSLCAASGALREAALVFIELGTENNRELLLDAFRDTALSLRNQLKTLEGQSLAIGCRQIGAIFDNAINLFKSDEIVQVFGLPPAPEDDWPLGANFSANGSYLVTEIIRTLEAANVARTSVGGVNKPISISMTQNKFDLLQRAAYYGGLAISETLADPKGGDNLQGLVGNTYKWTKALQRLIPDTLRVWKDQTYRSRLTDLEWGMVDPHPSGVISLPLAAGRTIELGYSTATVRGEVCCCSGDLVCSSNCEISPNPSCINCPTLDIGCPA